MLRSITRCPLVHASVTASQDRLTPQWGSGGYAMACRGKKAAPTLALAEADHLSLPPSAVQLRRVVKHLSSKARLKQAVKP